MAPGPLVLAGVSLELGDQQRRGDVPLLDGGTDPEQVIPVIHDPLGIDLLAHQGLHERRDGGGVDVP